MKYIVKGREPGVFSAWKALENPDWTPTYDDLRGAEKQAVKAALMQEQGYLCCYCERQLSDDDSHIEHFKPQHLADVDPLDYANLLCSCQNQLDKGVPRHCGNLKGDWFDAHLLVSPTSPDSEARFLYTADGHIFPRENDAAALATIQRLGLDIPKLVSMRSAAIAPFLDENLTHEELSHFVDGYLLKDADGRFGPFWTTIHGLFDGAFEIVD
ncbi:retron system putative HNH endonuclease [Ectothiorhodospira lacustris]|uniref:retron system putative HNH endonuclease n=1 Tax=Ectothiorhodospira lacustris TaxID=2899127 RepID=UPI001EE96721|nr:retron system putative HNH endonuclease [Ectothiorhodospira lacustris]MCG5499268.1 TIGR02646 family protein [Ectothiorhodospira lacustris]